MIGLATGSAILGALKSPAQPAGKTGTSKLTQNPWPYVELDPKKCAERAYKGFIKGHCMYGVFEGIVAEYAEKQGPEYANFPFDMLYVGAGGGNGWGTLCGALNGAMLALALFSKKYDPLVDELFNWYQVTPLPVFRPEKPRLEIPVKSVAKSTLCHMSVSRWCAAAKAKAFSDDRDERCGWLCGDVAMKTVELLNAQLAGTFKAAYPISAATAECRTCHDKGSSNENERGKMECDLCHFVHGDKHP